MRNSSEFRYSLNIPRYNASCGLWQKKGELKLFVIGGQDVEGKVTDTIEVLDWNHRDTCDFELSSIKTPVALCKSEVLY